MKRIVITGPESCGKTTLAQNLAKHFKSPVVKEYARDYLHKSGGTYKELDLIEIAKGQVSLEDAITQNFNQDWVFLDTDLISIKIWAREKYGFVDPWITDNISARNYDLHLLCRPDIPWTYDPLRENQHDRARLFKLYRSELHLYKRPFLEVKGLGDERLSNALELIENHFKLTAH